MDTSQLQDKYSAEEIIGLDLSCNCSGYAYYAEEEYTTGAIVAPTGKNKLDDIERLDFFRVKFENLIEALPQLRLAVVEGYSMGSKGAGLKVRETGGIAKNILHRNGISILLVSPSSLKLFATGKGNADSGHKDKPMMRHAAKIQFGIERKTTDEIDAFWLLQVGMYSTHSNPVRDRQRLTKIDAINGAELFINKHSKVADHGKIRRLESRVSTCIHRLRPRSSRRKPSVSSGNESNVRIARTRR